MKCQMFGSVRSSVMTGLSSHTSQLQCGHNSVDEHACVMDRSILSEAVVVICMSMYVLTGMAAKLRRHGRRSSVQEAGSSAGTAACAAKDMSKESVNCARVQRRCLPCRYGVVCDGHLHIMCSERPEGVPAPRQTDRLISHRQPPRQQSVQADSKSICIAAARSTSISSLAHS